MLQLCLWNFYAVLISHLESRYSLQNVLFINRLQEKYQFLNKYYCNLSRHPQTQKHICIYSSNCILWQSECQWWKLDTVELVKLAIETICGNEVQFISKALPNNVMQHRYYRSSQSHVNYRLATLCHTLFVW